MVVHQSQKMNFKIELLNILQSVYRLDHVHFDDDVNICILLTNEHILKNSLEENDSKFYLACIRDREIAQDKARKKKIDKQVTYKKNKKQRLILEMKLN